MPVSTHTTPTSSRSPSPESRIVSSFTYSVPPSDPSERPFIYAFIKEDDPDFKTTNIERIDFDCKVRDVRTEPPENWGLDDVGFEWNEGVDTSMSDENGDWEDEEKVKNVYAAEVMKFVKEKIPEATHLEMVGTTLRAPKEGMRPPAYLVHVDASRNLDFGARDTSDFPSLEDHRVRIFSVWRPIGHPAQDIPLGLCDWNSIDPERDFFEIDTIQPHQTHKFLAVAHNPSHRWYYISEQKPTDVWMFKMFDTKYTPEDRRTAGLVPHSAFQHPYWFGKEGVKPRKSVEMHVLVFSPKES